MQRDTYKVWIDQAGIIHAAFHHIVSEEALIESFRQRQIITTIPTPIMVHADHIIDADQRGMELACGEAMTQSTTALAIIAKGHMARFYARVFLRYHNPSYPVQIFTCEYAAHDWLRQYQNKDMLHEICHPGWFNEFPNAGRVH